MSSKEKICFIDNAALRGGSTSYIVVTVDAPQVLESWKNSLFSFEWLLPDGRIRSMEQLSEAEQIKRAGVESKLKAGQPIEKPLLGIGIMDNIEIGSGRAEFLTLLAHGQKKIPVHIPRSNESDFKDFITAVD